MNPCCVEDADLVFGAVKVVVFPGFELLSKDEKAKLLKFFKDAPFKGEVHALKDVSKGCANNFRSLRKMRIVKMEFRQQMSLKNKT